MDLSSSLNANQLRALNSPEDRVLQVLAGPGTGKTKVLTSRVAHLLVDEKLAPENVIVTTFTRKAANEMRQRLYAIFQDAKVDVDLKRLLVGTFHSICVRILRIHGRRCGLDPGFSIADDSDSQQIIKKILARRSAVPGSLGEGKVSVRAVRGEKAFISECKSQALFPEQVPANPKDFRSKEHIAIYREYQLDLTRNNLIDFDDCLLMTHKLLRENPKLLGNIQHVLVDEFQDTNKVQLELMYMLAHNNHVTIVGDPDQSIYGFRHAEADNFYKMEDHYTKVLHVPVAKIQLNENYRSTGGILDVSEKIIAKRVKKREPKSLMPHNDSKEPVSYDNYSSNTQEAVQIATQISESDAPRKDISIIIRAAFQSRLFEQELIRKHIPYVIVHGHSFWELKEVKLMVDLIRCVASGKDLLGWTRAMEFLVPGLGAKMLANIESAYEASKEKDMYRMVHNIADGELTGFTAKVRAGLSRFRKIIKHARHSVKDKTLPMSERLIHMYDGLISEFGLVNLVATKKNTKDARETVTENLNELKSQLMSFDPEIAAEQGLFVTDEPEQEASAVDGMDFLTRFLDSIYLYEQSHHKQSDEPKDDETGKVTITTIHGAKGLEWPIVFVPGLCNGILPSGHAMNEVDQTKCEQLLDEECRCLYVALTRAKSELHMSSFRQKESGWDSGAMDRTQFLPDSCMKGLAKHYHEEDDKKEEYRAGGFVKATDWTKYRTKNGRQALRSINQFQHIPKAKPTAFDHIPKARPSEFGHIPMAKPVVPTNQFSHIPAAKPVMMLKRPSTNSGSSTSAFAAAPTKKRKKRLGMGHPRPLAKFP